MDDMNGVIQVIGAEYMELIEPVLVSNASGGRSVTVQADHKAQHYADGQPVVCACCGRFFEREFPSSFCTTGLHAGKNIKLAPSFVDGLAYCSAECRAVVDAQDENGFTGHAKLLASQEKAVAELLVLYPAAEQIRVLPSLQNLRVPFVSFRVASMDKPFVWYGGNKFVDYGFYRIVLPEASEAAGV